MKKVMIFLAMLIFIGSSCKKELPIAEFFTTKDMVNVNESIICTNSSKNANSYIWQVELQTGFDYHFSPSFSAPGTYTIKLTATNEFGSDTFSKSIVVASKIKMDNTILIDGLYYAIQ